MGQPGWWSRVRRRRADLVAILEDLRDVLVRIEDKSVDRRYVDFGALAKRLEECIETVERLPLPDESE